MLKLLALVVSEILINHFVTAAAADIDDSIKRKRYRVSLKNRWQINKKYGVPQNNKGTLARGLQAPSYRPSTFLRSLDLPPHESFMRSVSAKWPGQCQRIEPDGFPPTQFVNFRRKCTLRRLSTMVDVAHKTASIKSQKNKAIYQKWICSDRKMWTRSPS